MTAHQAVAHQMVSPTGAPVINARRVSMIGVKGWYHAVFRDAKGGERLLSIDQVLDNM
jgi:hypothetical protein